jgi:hypothetical protein
MQITTNDKAVRRKNGKRLAENSGKLPHKLLGIRPETLPSGCLGW